MADRRLAIARSISRLPNLAGERAARLADLIDLNPDDLADVSFDGRLKVARMLRRALKAERRRASEGSPDYSLARHAAILRACRGEETALTRALRKELFAASDLKRAA